MAVIPATAAALSQAKRDDGDRLPLYAAAISQKFVAGLAESWVRCLAICSLSVSVR
jgi:hypothetical protein